MLVAIFFCLTNSLSPVGFSAAAVIFASTGTPTETDRTAEKEQVTKNVIWISCMLLLFVDEYAGGDKIYIYATSPTTHVTLD